MKTEISKIGRRGTLVIPAGLRKRFGIQEGTQVIAEEREDGILIRPSVTLPIERYTPLRRAEFLLSNAVDEDDYARAAKEVRRLGLDPTSIPHHSPGPRRKPRKA